MQLSSKLIKEFQDICEQEYGKKLTGEQASEAAHDIVGFYKLLWDIDVRERMRKDQLKEHPKGFHLDDGGTYNCCVCRQYISDKQAWYDKNGIKCIICQKALDKKIIPASACRNRDSWYALWELEDYFGLKYQTAKKFVRQGKLKSRIVPNSEGKVHCELFLIKDNLSVLPEKPKSFLVKDEDGKYHTEYEPVKITKLLDGEGKS